MNTLQVFSIFDSKAMAYLQPFFMPNAATASREFESACNDPNTAFFKHPGDYELFHIGEWDQYAGKLVSLDHQMSLGLATQYRKDR